LEGKVLLIDDDPGILESFTHLLKKKGFEVETAENGKEGLEKMKTFKPDLIISDMRMPEMDGVELMENIPGVKGFFPGKIIFTGFDDSEVLNLSHMREGGVFRVEKDRWEHDLPSAIARALELANMQKEAWNMGEENARLMMMRDTGRILSHELNNLLQNIISGNELLMLQNGEEEGNRIISKNVERIKEVKGRLTGIFRQKSAEDKGEQEK